MGEEKGEMVGKMCGERGKSVGEVVVEGGVLSEGEVEDILWVENVMEGG